MVKIGITARLFLSLLIVSVLTAVGVGLGTRWSFQRGFQGYLNEVEARRMEAMAFEFAQAYAENGHDWAFIRGNRAAWERYTGAIGRERATAARPGATPSITPCPTRRRAVSACMTCKAGTWPAICRTARTCAINRSWL